MQVPPPPPFQIAFIAAILKIVVVVGYIMLAVPMLVWLERKLLADFQARVGPDRVGPFGLLQTFADGIKLVAKEGVIPADVDLLLYLTAPVIIMIPALSVAAVVPFGGDLYLNLSGKEYLIRMVIADLPVGFLFVLALTSLSVYGIVFSGWASNNKYSLLGGLRSAAQMVSYELPMGLSVIAGLMIASARTPKSADFFSLSLAQVVDLQQGWLIPGWIAFDWRFICLGLVAAVTFYIGGLAETNRAPFDLPEAETELIGGYHTEYGGLRWAMFFLGEYAAMLNVSAVATTLYFGGWHSPYPDGFLGVGSIPYMLHGLLWFGIKVFAIITVYIWIRATLPRIRYDQLMAFTWKGLLPFTLAVVMVIACILTAGYGAAVPPVLAQSEAAFLPGAGPGGPTGAAAAPGASPFTPGPRRRGLGNLPGGMLAPPGNGPAGTPGNAPGAIGAIGNAPAGGNEAPPPGGAPAAGSVPAPGGAPAGKK